MPPEREAARILLASAGLDAAVGVAWEFEPAQITAAVERWQERRIDGESLGPGWIVWRLKQGPIEARSTEAGSGRDWMEERYQRFGGPGRPG